jgi:arylformamidase
MGRGVYVDFKETVKPNGHITAADLDREASMVKEGDIVIIDSSYKLPPFTKDTNTEIDKRLFVGAESAEWFRDHKVRCVAFGDGVSIENCNEDVKPFHDILLAENIIFIEVLKNLELLEKDVFFMSFSPLPIVGLDSSPVHAYAIEGMKEFS